VSEGPDGESRAFVLDLLAGRCRAQAVSTAATLGLADRLAAGPRGAAELAAELGCDAPALQRLLALLAGLGVCEELRGGRFALAPRGQALRSDALGPLAVFLGMPAAWDAWSHLPEALAAGSAAAFERAHGEGLYAFLGRHPDVARAYDRAIDAYSRAETEALCARLDLSSAERVVDVGGGRGAALVGLLQRWPRLRGVLVELPHVAARARPRLEAERLEIVECDYLESLPQGADVYLLKHVLHNLDDARATALLRRAAAALAPGGRVLVVEAVLAPADHGNSARLLDLEMLVLTGGRERRKPEWRRLLRAAGLRVDRLEPLTPESWLITGSATANRAGLRWGASSDPQRP
jgi:SAM-dependent methyltransferase